MHFVRSRYLSVFLRRQDVGARTPKRGTDAAQRSVLGDKFVIEKHPNYKRLEDSDPDNAYLIKDIETVKFNDETETESGENIYSEPVEDSGDTDKTSSEDVPKKDDEIEQSVTIEDIIGHQVHTANVPKPFPKDPKTGTAASRRNLTPLPQKRDTMSRNIGQQAASLDDTDMVVTAEPHLRPPYTEVAEESYLDDWDTI